MKKHVFLLVLLLLSFSFAAKAESHIMSSTGSDLLISAEGEVLAPAGIYSELIPLSNSGMYAGIQFGGTRCALVSSSGESITDFVFDSLEYDGTRIVYSMGGRYGIMTLTGNRLTDAKYSHMVKADDHYLASKSDYLDDTPDGVWRVYTDAAEEFTGKKLLYGPFPAGEDMFIAVTAKGEYGYIDGMGEWVEEPAFTWCSEFRDGFALARNESGTGIIDSSLQWVVEPQYTGIIPCTFRSGAPYLCYRDASVFLVSLPEGTEIALPEGIRSLAFTGDKLSGVVNGVLCLLDYDGNILYEAPEDAAKLTDCGNCILLERCFSCELPFSIVYPDGSESDPYRKLEYAGDLNGEPCFVEINFDAVRSECEGYTFYDEVPGSRSYGLITSRGKVLINGLTSLRKGASGLFTAETDDTIALISLDGSELMHITKDE